MNNKLGTVALAVFFTITGGILRDTQLANANQLILAQGYGGQQGSPWGQVAAPQTYRNPDTGQQFCFYSSSLWAPCPNHGTVTIVPRNAKCRGSDTTQAVVDGCPYAQCSLARLRADLNSLSGSGYSTPALPCNGLP